MRPRVPSSILNPGEACRWIRDAVVVAKECNRVCRQDRGRRAGRRNKQETILTEEKKQKNGGMAD